MPDEKKKPPKKEKSAPKKSQPPAAGGPAGPPPGPPMGSPMGMDPMGMDPLAMAMGAPPPMPGTGIDPYAAMAGQVSAGPLPMGGLPPGGGMGMGPPPMMGGGMAPNFGAPEDILTHALMGELNPAAAGNAELGQTALDPDQGGMPEPSLQQLLMLLALAQGGIPSSGLQPPGQGSSGVLGIRPGMGGF